MRIAIVSSLFPPDPGGVSDYVERFSSAVAALGHEVSVWTGPSARPRVSAAELVEHSDGWGILGLKSLEWRLRARKPDAVIIQYTPYMYAPRKLRGIHPALPAWVLGLEKRLGCRVVVMFHELHYPLGLSRDRLLVGTPQFVVYELLAAAAQSSWFTYEAALARTASLHPARKLRWLPVGATIEPSRATEAARGLIAAAPAPRILLQFGSSHPSRLFSHSFNALDRARAALGRDQVSLVFAGLAPEEVSLQLRECGRKDLSGSVHGLGYLPADQTSAWLERADCVLAPFVDGISARRSSAMAALAHGRPLVTTSGPSTDPGVEWERFSLVSPADRPDLFAENVATILKDPAFARELAERGKKRYAELFSWPVIARRALQYLAE